MDGEMQFSQANAQHRCTAVTLLHTHSLTHNISFMDFTDCISHFSLKKRNILKIHACLLGPAETDSSAPSGCQADNTQPWICEWMFGRSSPLDGRPVCPVVDPAGCNLTSYKGLKQSIPDS